VLSRARWLFWSPAKALATFLVALAEEHGVEGWILVAGDDTVAGAKGAKVYGKGCHHNEEEVAATGRLKKTTVDWYSLTTSVRPFEPHKIGKSRAKKTSKYQFLHSLGARRLLFLQRYDGRLPAGHVFGLQAGLSLAAVFPPGGVVGPHEAHVGVGGDGVFQSRPPRNRR
jgi:hypothetical protein